MSEEITFLAKVQRELHPYVKMHIPRIIQTTMRLEVGDVVEVKMKVVKRKCDVRIDTDEKLK